MSTGSKMKKVFEEKKLSGDGRGRKSRGRGSSRAFRGRFCCEERSWQQGTRKFGIGLDWLDWNLVRAEPRKPQPEPRLHPIPFTAFRTYQPAPAYLYLCRLRVAPWPASFLHAL